MKCSGSAQKKGKVWYCVVRQYPGAKPKWIKGGRTKREAQGKLTEIMHEMNSGTYKVLKESTFEDFSRKWLSICEPPQLKESTYKSYIHIVESNLIPYFEGFKLCDITPVKLQEYVTEKSKIVKPKTVNNHLVPLQKMLKDAVVWGYLQVDPSIHLKKLRVDKEEMDFLNPQEVRGLLEAVKEHNPKQDQDHALIMTAIYTGVRRGELFGLKWGDVEFHTGSIFVKRSLYNGKFTTPKTKGSKRQIQMSPNLMVILKKYRMKSEPNEFDLVFANEAGKPIDPDNWVKRHFKPALRRGCLRAIRFHDLRHTYATLLINAGENIKFIQSQMGHASIQTTMDRYGHLYPEVNLGVGARLDQMVDHGEVADEKIGNQPLENEGSGNGC